MDTLCLALSVLTFALWAPSTLEMLVGHFLTPVLSRFEPLPDSECPRLSIVAPACNEERTIEPAMRSLLRLDYPALEIVGVDDRSTDRTGEILDRLAAEDPRLRVLHVTELPAGWLGKNHALQRGSEQASGEWLLFTDADVIYQPDALRRAMALVRRRACDHLCCFPRMLLEGFWERTFVGYFMVMFSFRFRTWQAPWRWAPGYVGVGAFNLIRAAVYRSLGGHEPLRMEVADDIKLGKVIKRRGCRQCLASAGDLIQVRWLVGLRGLVDGLTKNAFAGVAYSWVNAAASGAALMVGGLWPPAGLFVGPPAGRWACGAALGTMLIAAACQWRTSRTSPLYALAWPLASVLFLYIIIRSGVLAERQGGIYWRGTFYPLEELRRNRVR